MPPKDYYKQHPEKLVNPNAVALSWAHAGMDCAAARGNFTELADNTYIACRLQAVLGDPDYKVWL